MPDKKCNVFFKTLCPLCYVLATANLNCPEQAGAKVTQLVKDPTWFGDDLLVMFPKPSCPTLLKPQAHNVPSVLIANEEEEVLAILDQLVNNPTCFGDEYAVVLPRPS